MGNICVCVHPSKKAGAAQAGCKVITKHEKGNIKRINQYTVLKELGPCAFGMVSLVVDSQQKQFAMRTGQRRFLSPSGMGFSLIHLFIWAPKEGGGDSRQTFRHGMN